MLRFVIIWEGGRMSQRPSGHTPTC